MVVGRGGLKEDIIVGCALVRGGVGMTSLSLSRRANLVIGVNRVCGFTRLPVNAAGSSLSTSETLLGG